MKQFKTPERNIFQVGDTVRFRLEMPPDELGEAMLRTTIGFAAEQRREVIECTDSGRMLDGLAWHDLSMAAVEPGRYELTLPLTEVGVFEAKCCFRPAGRDKLRWPEGGNFRIKVEASANVAGNTIYCAFVRQFGPDRGDARPEERQLSELDRAGYTVIPPSGTFRDLAARLDHIFDTLGFRILQLLPIHPTPTVYGRMGRYGSPFAALDYFAVDPALARFDPAATPFEQFLELVDAVHAKKGRIFLDIPVNHTGWASRLQNEHPDYFIRRGDRTFENPGAWGVVWEDLCKLNYSDTRVHALMTGVFLHWCRAGVDGFRCDAGYMLPPEAWCYITAKVREEFPDTVFMLEGLGGKISVQEELLAEHGLDWAYSELFQNYSRDEVSGCQSYLSRCSADFGLLVNFAETHDNSRLAAGGAVYAKMRCMLAGLLAENGAFGITNGVEFLATAKIDVHGSSPLNWGAEPNLVAELGRLNRLLSSHPLFRAGSRVEQIQYGDGNFIAVRRGMPGTAAQLLALVNLDVLHPVTAAWRAADFAGAEGIDLLTGERVVFHGGAAVRSLPLAPGAARCFSTDPADLERLNAALAGPAGEPEAVTAQRAAEQALRLIRFFAPASPDFDREAGVELRRDPRSFCRRICDAAVPALTGFTVGRDERRIVPLPPGDALLIESEFPFRAELRIDGRVCCRTVSLPYLDRAGEFAVMTPPKRRPHTMREIELALAVFGDRPRRLSGKLLQLAEPDLLRCKMRFRGKAAVAGDLLAFAANTHGGMTLTRAEWGALHSKYDALLAGNGVAPFPVDRRTMFTRCRGWLVADDYSQEIDAKTLNLFSAGSNCAEWHFVIPSGQGRMSRLSIELAGALDGDAIKLRFRLAAAERGRSAPAVRIILRPDLEDRVNHGVTKAYLGPERDFPAAIRTGRDRLIFAPAADRQLQIEVPGSRFVAEPEWQYMARLRDEEYYGLESATDLFSPGYFEFGLNPGGEAELFAAITPGGDGRPEQFRWPATGFVDGQAPAAALKAALRPFLVERDAFKTVIAGYPWFLDWGRDTLIALRGYIRAGYRDEAAAILRQFASFESDGTIPNVIHGRHVGNRDTSDAPLWLLVAARDYVDFFGDDALFDADCGGRSFGEVLRSIVRHYRSGTPNGIKVDPASALVFSPPHFTWMDTNFPAGTPRAGYPIEIQALWIAGLQFLGRRDAEAAALAERAAASLERLFFRPELGRFADCRHADAGTSAAAATPDDHLRPNQLLAVTLGAVKTASLRLAAVESSAELLAPGVIRSLADRPVAYELPVSLHGRLLNDPVRPYRGVYAGPEDTSRKAAYHNGTAWGWLFPSYCEALDLVGGTAGRKRALALLGSVMRPAAAGVPGQLPEIADGDAPHRPGGCPAQAWSVSEAFRVFDLLSSGAGGE